VGEFFFGKKSTKNLTQKIHVHLVLFQNIIQQERTKDQLKKQEGNSKHFIPDPVIITQIILIHSSALHQQDKIRFR